MKNYFIKSDYAHRTSYEFYDDTESTDDWQKEVYEHAETLFRLNNFSSIIDFGCGSAYKLIKHFGNVNFVGIDVEETVNKLKQKYPNYTWSENIEDFNNFDLFISSDVVEHLLDPDVLIENIKKCNPKLIILSTPDRDLLRKGRPDGPPKNPCHVREWNFQEFENYIGSHFTVIEHYISNEIQATQVIVAKIKTQ